MKLRFSKWWYFLLAFFLLLIIESAWQSRYNTKAAARIIYKIPFSQLLNHQIPQRGSIYARNGQVLAAHRTVYEIGVYPRWVENPQSIATVLSRELDYNKTQVESLASYPYQPNKIEYIPLGHHVESAQISSLYTLKKMNQEQFSAWAETFNISIDSQANYNLKGMVWAPYQTRNYPNNSSASNLLGFVNFLERRGYRSYYGIESYYHEQLETGANIHLTIDLDLQTRLEQMLDQQMINSGAKAGSILVLNSINGEVYGMATTRRFNLNQYWHKFNSEPSSIPFNPLIAQSYEPGSIFDLFTLAIALDHDVIDRDTIFVDDGIYMMGAVIFKNWDRRAHGKINMSECLSTSSNICTIWLADKTGLKDFYSALNKFGFNRLSGIDLAGEDYLPLSQPGDSRWYPSDLGANAFGHGLALTPIQIATAATALANHGQMVVPHLLDFTQYGMQSVPTQTQTSGNPISPHTAEILNEILQQKEVIDNENLFVQGAQFVGMQGLAQVPDLQTGYRKDVLSQSYLGWGPVEEPQVVIHVWLEEIPYDDTLDTLPPAYATDLFSRAAAATMER